MMALASFVATLALSSPAFASGHAIPAPYTCDGRDVSPPLRWTAPPPGTRSLALTVVDLDTRPPFFHWRLAGISPRLRALAAGTHAGRADGNSFGRIGYGGPCPPPGETHRYRFELAALGANGHVLARASLVGTYRR